MNPATDKVERIEVAEVVFDARQAGVTPSLTYRNSVGAVRGDVVLAPIGSRTLLGVVASSGLMSEADLLFDAGRLREISRPIQGLALPRHALPMAQFISEEYLCPLAQILPLFLMPGAKERVVATWTKLREPKPDDALTPSQQEVLRAMSDLGGSLIVNKSKPLAPSALRAMRALKQKGFVVESYAYAPGAIRHALPEALRLTPDIARAEAYLASAGKKRPAQAVTLMRLLDAPNAVLSSQEIKALCGVSESTVAALYKLGLIVEVESGKAALEVAPTPTSEQMAAAEQLIGAVQDKLAESFLLFGVTGSGKTEVFLRAAGEALKMGRQVLYLVPEIALTAQVIGQLRARFGTSIAVLHSNLTPAERQTAWHEISQGQVPVVLGPRSALFAPFQDLGLIIVDEEHEGSYKQENSPRYHAKKVVRFLAKHFSCPVVFGSATPSFESYFESVNGQMKRLELRARATGATLPAVRIVNLAELYQQGQPAMFTHELVEGMAERLKRKEQTVLFLNRRAYAPILGCRDCGHVLTCSNCSVSLSYHKRVNQLVCHYCDDHFAAPIACPDCGGMKLRPLGMGTEKVEENVRELFPEARIARLDRDTAKRKGSVEETIAKMRTGELDILIGTQMVAKGLDFPSVTLVGVVLADTSLHLPDFRAAERAYQLLSQVSGRSGRGRNPGEVIIQTFDPHHLVIQSVQLHDFVAYYREAIWEREEAGYPPFRRLVNVVVSGEDELEVQRVSMQIRQGLLRSTGLPEILGPARCPLERLQGQWRRHLLIKLQGDELSMYEIEQAIAAADQQRVRVTIDVDPQSML